MKSIVITYIAVFLGIASLLFFASSSTAYILDEMLDIEMRSEAIALKNLF